MLVTTSFIAHYKTIVTAEHLDFIGHVNNATYLQLMEDARWHMYDHFGYNKEIVQEEKKGPIVLETHIKYRKEVLLDEVIAIETNCTNYRGLLGEIHQTIYKEDGKRSCYADLTFGFFDLVQRKLISAQGLWKEIHDKMLDDNNLQNKR